MTKPTSEETTYEFSYKKLRWAIGLIMAIIFTLSVMSPIRFIKSVMNLSFAHENRIFRVDFILITFGTLLGLLIWRLLPRFDNTYRVLSEGLEITSHGKRRLVLWAAIKKISIHAQYQAYSTISSIDYENAPGRGLVFNPFLDLMSWLFPRYNRLISDIACHVPAAKLDLGTVALVELNKRAEAYLAVSKNLRTAVDKRLYRGYRRFAYLPTIDHLIGFDVILFRAAARHGNSEGAKAAILKNAIQSTYGSVYKLCEKYPDALEDVLVRLCYARALNLLKKQDEALEQIDKVLKSGRYEAQAQAVLAEINKRSL
jgi:hypothetical protein